MALIVKDRVLETCSTSGLVTFTLTGAVTGYQRFSAIGNGNTTYYAAYVIGGTEWEVGIGTVGTSSLTRDTILSSSTGSKINFSSSPVVWCDLPSSKAVFFDANNNISVNSIFEGFTSIAASASLITLTASSTPYYLVTGSGGQTIKLPDATTLPIGAVFDFNNNQSSGAITVNNNSNTLVVSIPSGGYTSVILTANSNAAGTWDRHDQAPSNVSWSTNTFDYPGSITSATWNGSTVAVNRGGTGLGSTPTNGQLLIGNGTNYSLATLTAGTNIAITNTAGGISIATTGTAAGVDQTDIGTRANQIPLNQYLGTMAWQDAKAVNIQGGTAVLNGATITSASPVTLVMSNTNGTGYDTTITNTYSASENFSITTNSKKILSYSSSGTGGGGTTSISAGAGSVCVFSSLVPALYLNGASGTNAVGFKAGTGSVGALEFYTNALERMRLHQSGGLSLGNTTDRGAGNLNLSGVVITGGYTVATLPTGVVGMRAYVTNASAPSYGATVMGGGAVTIPVFYNGTNWIVA